MKNQRTMTERRAVILARFCDRRGFIGFGLSMASIAQNGTGHEQSVSNWWEDYVSHLVARKKLNQN